jgi:1-acyl-sn-glycerol-3-phosphate acyltransferase
MRPRSRFDSWLWLPWNFVQGFYTVLWTALWIAVALVVAGVAGTRPALALARRAWAPGLLVGAGARLVVTGLERLDLSRAHLFVANHQSFIDIPALFRVLPLPIHFLAKRELAAVPFLGWYIGAMGMVFVDRRDARQGRDTVSRAAALLAAGKSVVAFPEGTRSRDGRLHAFRPGTFGAAIEAGVDVVPVALVGSGEVLPAGGFRVRPGTIEVRIGAPIPTSGASAPARRELALAAERAVRELRAASAVRMPDRGAPTP